MRGKVPAWLFPVKSKRITPAYAGKSILELSNLKMHGDHPRLCGEKRFRSTKRAAFQGSPPPMRGKVYSLTRFSSCSRITPAYAGKSYSRVRLRRGFGDHPRLCGEKFRQIGNGLEAYGSPPPMRGKGLFCVCIQMCSEDHPRLCGEKSDDISVTKTYSGSPPPMRGKANDLHILFNSFRITPAYAGKSLRHTAPA